MIQDFVNYCLILSPTSSGFEVSISRRRILIVYQTQLQEAASSESLIRHGNLDTRGMFQFFEEKPLG